MFNIGIHLQADYESTINVVDFSSFATVRIEYGGSEVTLFCRDLSAAMGLKDALVACCVTPPTVIHPGVEALNPRIIPTVVKSDIPF